MSETLLTTRFAEPTDAIELSEIYEDAWRNTYQGLIPHVSLQQMINKRGPGWWQRSLQSKRNVVILEFDGEIAGYASVGSNRTPELPFAGEVQELYLQPHFQGVGFGKELFRQARSALTRRGMHSVVIWALKENESAVRFYLNQGGDPVAKSFEKFGACRLEKVAFGWRR